ncbi:MAG: hypothetical protein KZQ80_04500 [Candidatus Thiodiazotropha sp. (ex Monitilora ramsayi)]|nr:hypothetical protein [Candidatus Thiodiazotropha sp. (ex Monitilora ramsayi)]
MKVPYVNYRVFKHRLFGLFTLVCLSFNGSLLAQQHDEFSGDLSYGGQEQVVTGPFDGLDLKTKQIWINDMVYLMDSSMKVIGTSVKLGLITDIKQGEEIKATLVPNQKSPSVPYVIKIERQ